MPTMANKQDFHYEFNGPIGTLVMMMALPLVSLLLGYWSRVGRVDLTFLQDFSEKRFWDAVLESSVLCPGCQLEQDQSWTDSILFKCVLGLLGYFLFLVLLERMLPCELVQGAPVKGDKNHRLTYRINGHLTFWVTLLVVQVGWPYFDKDHGVWQFGLAPLRILYDFFCSLALVMTMLCFGLSLYLYLSSFAPGRILADGGDSGNCVYDYFMGRELNPRWYSFDWKVFCELRPGLIGWMLLNMSSVVQQQERLGYVTGSMILINIFQGIYVWDALYQERAILTTMDVTTDGFGFMLVFGDLVWLPFTYSIQARYLVEHDPHLSLWTLMAIVGLHVFGYIIFRGANGQKDAFRRNPQDPSVSHLKYLQTKRGTKLLTSGWWGMARKINYTGDYIMGLSWCLVCGFDSIVPYYYAIYFCFLLVHRSMRDDAMCQAKYGKDWQTYKELVPYRFIPGVC